jgi:hypothetical protein
VLGELVGVGEEGLPDADGFGQPAVFVQGRTNRHNDSSVLQGARRGSFSLNASVAIDHQHHAECEKRDEDFAQHAYQDGPPALTDKIT